MRPRIPAGGLGWAAPIGLAGAGLLCLLAGCLHQQTVPATALAERILPPAFTFMDDRANPPASPPGNLRTDKSASMLCEAAAGELSLEACLALAEQNNPRLRQMLARVDQARAGEAIAFAGFLPEANGTHRHIQASRESDRFALPTLPTAVGNVAFGAPSDLFRATELHLQWTVYDFGKTRARYGQSLVGVEIATLQWERARQTVAFDVRAAYYGVLRAQAALKIAEETVKRVESIVRDAHNFLKRGTAVRNDVLRSEVLLSEARFALVSARTAEGVAKAGLLRELGANSNSPIALVDSLDFQEGVPPLDDALRLSVQNRPEFTAALKAISSTRLGEDAARAEFLPRVVVGGTAAHQESEAERPRNLVSGGLGLEINLFQGGRNLGKLRHARADTALAIAQGQEVCDRIAYEVDIAFLGIADARQRIELARKGLEFGRENLRVVRSSFERGDATPTDIADAELAFVRAQEQAATARYDLQIARARLAYAIGTEWPSVDGEEPAQTAPEEAKP